jgi:hypothetical protein
MARITPPLGTKGLFSLRIPFTALANIVYRVGAERTFEEMISQGLDPMALVYTPVGLSTTDYDADKVAGAAVITLLSDTQKPLYVPDTYIDSYPNMDVVPHQRVVMAADLGMLPDTYDFTRAMAAYGKAISDDIGVVPTIMLCVAPTADAITQEQYVQNLAARNAAIKNRTTDYAKVLVLQDQVASLTQSNAELVTVIEQLQQVIIDMGGTPPGT